MATTGICQASLFLSLAFSFSFPVSRKDKSLPHDPRVPGDKPDQAAPIQPRFFLIVSFFSFLNLHFVNFLAKEGEAMVKLVIL